MAKAPRLRWRRQPNETGLRSVGQSPRGAELRLGETVVARVSAWKPSGFGHNYRGWYWTGSIGEERWNTYSPDGPCFGDVDVAKAFVMATVRRALENSDG